MKCRLLLVLFLFVISNSLCLAQKSTLWGMTEFGGATNHGTIFSYDIKTNTEKVVYNFGSQGTRDGTEPEGSLIQASDGLLYGMTHEGGVNGWDLNQEFGNGTIFSYDINTGKETVLYSFGSFGDYGRNSDGAIPYGTLLQSGDSLLGMTEEGGANANGTIFSYKIKTGKVSVQYSFDATEGESQNYGSLMRASDGLFYGHEHAKPNDGGTIFSYTNQAHRVQVKGIFDFKNTRTDGASPCGGLLEDDVY